jgi:hypothetical protein
MKKGNELLEIMAEASEKDWHNVKIDHFAGWHDAWQISAVKKDTRWLIGYSTDSEGAGVAAHRARVFLGIN